MVLNRIIDITKYPKLLCLCRVIIGIIRSIKIAPMLIYCYMIKFYKFFFSKENDEGMNELSNDKKSISFCGGGCKAIYQIGVYSGLCKHDKTYFNDMHCIGSSMGAVTAAIACSNIDLSLFYKLIYKLQIDYREDLYNNITTCGERIRDICEKIFPENIHEIVSGKCFILIVYLTKYGFKKEIISKFESKKDLIDCIIASQFIPLWTDTKLFTYRNKYCIDSTLLYDYPTLNDNTIIVSFAPVGDIHPKINYDEVMSTYIPLPLEKVKDIINDGFDDATRYLREKEK